MIKSRQPRPVVPVVGWQGEKHQSFRVLRLDEVKGETPKDGHDPRTPHRIGFHALMLVADGEFDHWIDFKVHGLRSNQLIYVAPNQIHRFVECTSQHTVWALIFRPEIFPAGLQQTYGRQAPWSIVSYLWPSITKLTHAESAIIVEHLELLRRLDSVCQAGCRDSANHFVCGIISLAYAFATRELSKLADLSANSRFLEFVQLVEEFFASRRDVKWYAEQMDCSQKTLNRACQQMMGESAKVLLSRRVVIEAKRLLTQNADSVSAIAETLGFDATTNFVRYFRNDTGVTPQVFREAHGAERHL